MKWETAIELGKECGLTEPAEFYNNIILHFRSIFPYNKVDEEFEELHQEALKAGVRFSKFCGCALIDGDSEDDFCYICRKLRELKK